MTDFAAKLAERLAGRAVHPAAPELAIAQWRIVVDTGTATEVGLKDNRPGGPYDAPNTVTATRGEAYVVWSDGKISTGVIDRTTLDALDEDLVLWRTAAFEDPWAPEVPGPVAVPDVPLWDAGAAALVEQDQAPLFAALDRFRAELPPYGVELVSGSITASTSRRRLITSAGLDHTGRGTSVGAYADADHRAYDYLSLRRPPTDDELGGVIRRVGELNRLLRQDATLRPGRQPIVFWPSSAESMISKFLIANLDGQRVLSGGGAFTMAQFEAGEAVFHPSFDFGIDPTRPLSAGSYEISREGVPARALRCIEGGRLVTPLLDMKHAKKAGRPPTSMPRGGSSLWLPEPMSDVETLVAGLERGLIVHQMLGLHTQDSARGSFSLTVALGLVVENGKALGRAKAIIAGNFLEALREGVTFASVPGKDGLALMISAEVLPG